MERGQTVKITDSPVGEREMDAHLRIPPPSIHASPTSSPGPALSSSMKLGNTVFRGLG